MLKLKRVEFFYFCIFFKWAHFHLQLVLSTFFCSWDLLVFSSPSTSIITWPIAGFSFIYISFEIALQAEMGRKTLSWEIVLKNLRQTFKNERFELEKRLISVWRNKKSLSNRNLEWPKYSSNFTHHSYTTPTKIINKRDPSIT